LKNAKENKAKCLVSIHEASKTNASSVRLKNRSAFVLDSMTDLNKSDGLAQTSCKLALEDAKQVIEKVRAINDLSSALKGPLADEMQRLDEEINALTESKASFDKEMEELIEERDDLDARVKDLTREHNAVESEIRSLQAVSKDATVDNIRLQGLLNLLKLEEEQLKTIHETAVANENIIIETATKEKDKSIKSLTDMVDADTNAKSQIASNISEAEMLASSTQKVVEETAAILANAEALAKRTESMRQEEKAEVEKLVGVINGTGKGSVEELTAAKEALSQAELDVAEAKITTAHFDRACTLAENTLENVLFTEKNLYQELLQLLNTRFCGTDPADTSTFHVESRKALLDSFSSSLFKKDTSVEEDELMIGVPNPNIEVARKVLDEAVSDCKAFTDLKSLNQARWEDQLFELHSSVLGKVAQMKFISDRAAGDGAGVGAASITTASSSAMKKVAGYDGSKRRPSGTLEAGLPPMYTFRGFEGFYLENNLKLDTEMKKIVDSLSPALHYLDVNLDDDSFVNYGAAAKDNELEMTPTFVVEAMKLASSSSFSAAHKAKAKAQAEEIAKLQREINSYEERIKTAQTLEKNAKNNSVQELNRIDDESKTLTL
jgi:FtsZ-binding cell division protein ZapB